MEIVLIRHGKPVAAVNRMMSALEYRKWVRQYHLSEVSNSSRPNHQHVQDYKSHFVVSSDLKRALHSAYIFTGKSPELIDKTLREMELPRYKLPLYLPSMVWLYSCRIFWLLRFKGHFETYKQSKVRSIRAALTLIRLAEKEEKIVVFGHGLINRFIRKALIKKGWKLTTKNSDYWGVTVLRYARIS